jgi:UDP-glucose 4-epimerase
MLLITGATGFVGRHVVKKVSKTRDDIRILATSDFAAARKTYPNMDVVAGDITRRETLRGLGKDVDTVIHLAGMVSYSKPRDVLMMVNVKGTQNVLEECKDAERFIFASSVSVYGEISGQKPANESYPTKPENLYGRSKLEAERVIVGSGLPHTILRIAPIYGAGSPDWMKNLALLEKGFPIPNTKNLTHVTHISNASSAFHLALTNRFNGLFNIADAQPVGFVHMAEKVVHLLGKKPNVVPFWYAALLASLAGKGQYMKVLTMNRSYDISAAKNKLGYIPGGDTDKNLREMVEWYKSESGK